MEPSLRYVRLAAATVIAFSVGMPLVNVAVFVTVDGFAGAGTGQPVAFVVATVVYLPIHVRLVWGAARGRLPTRAGWLLAAEAAIILAAVPLAGDTWLRSFTPLALAVLIVFRPPWSVVVYVGLGLAPFALAAVAGRPLWLAVSAATGVGSALGLYTLVWIMDAIRRLQSAHLMLASQAVSMERLRIDDELRRTVGADLAYIVTAGEQAYGSVAGNPADAVTQLRDLVRASRRALAKARRMIHGYQQVPLINELETAVTLLRAAGIETRLVLPDERLPDIVEAGVRSTLRTVTGRLLLDSSARQCLITVSCRDGRVALDITSDVGAA